MCLIFSHYSVSTVAVVSVMDIEHVQTLFSIKRLRIHLEMKHTELSRDQVKRQLASLRTRRRAKTGDVQLCSCVWFCFLESLTLH